ncbi:uncharacterized protein [Venturia canescens]|uniref:uncharacterized protein isoform X2 n=1 Tax=Venturia canescens TaxID=32260 RepID=UPI001C9C43DD|nr:uncharacterized protein LOC122419170 isoform X2 [Venturia canescens]
MRDTKYRQQKGCTEALMQGRKSSRKTKMDFVSSKGSEDQLLSDWLKCIHQTNREYERIIEDGVQFWIPFMAIPPPVVKELFKVSESCDFTPNTRYIALYLYDKFICNTFWEAYTSENGDDKGTTNSWEQTCKRISSQAKLRLMSCLQIASKMDTHSAGLRITQVISILREIDNKQEYTPNTILASEFKVFKTVGFKIPFCTPLDCAGILIKALGLEKIPQIIDIVVHLLDLSFLEHNQLYTNLRLKTNGRRARTEKEKKDFMAMEINSLYLGASVVLCTSLVYCWAPKNSQKLAAKLADLVTIDKYDLRLMADVLFAMAVQVENGKH